MAGFEPKLKFRGNRCIYPRKLNQIPYQKLSWEQCLCNYWNLTLACFPLGIGIIVEEHMSSGTTPWISIAENNSEMCVANSLQPFIKWSAANQSLTILSSSEMTYIVSSGALNSTHSLTPLCEPSEWRRGTEPYSFAHDFGYNPVARSPAVDPHSVPE